MFYKCSSLISLNLSNFYITNVTNMKSMFYNCSSLTFLDLINFSFNDYTNIQNMFFGVNKSHQLINFFFFFCIYSIRITFSNKFNI